MQVMQAMQVIHKSVNKFSASVNYYSCVIFLSNWSEPTQKSKSQINVFNTLEDFLLMRLESLLGLTKLSFLWRTKPLHFSISLSISVPFLPLFTSIYSSVFTTSIFIYQFHSISVLCDRIVFIHCIVQILWIALRQTGISVMIKYDLFLVCIHTNENAFTLFCGG